MDEESAFQALESDLQEALLALDELAVEDPEEALVMFDKLPEEVQALPPFQISLSQIHRACGQLEVTIDLLRALLNQELSLSDEEEVHRLLGDALEDEGQLEIATEHFLKSAALSKQRFEEEGYDLREAVRRATEVAKEAIEAFTNDEETDVDGVELIVADFPNEDEIRDGLDPQVSYQVLTREELSDYPRIFEGSSSENNEELVFIVYAMNLVLEFDCDGEFLDDLQEILFDALDSQLSGSDED